MPPTPRDARTQEQAPEAGNGAPWGRFNRWLARLGARRGSHPPEEEALAALIRTSPQPIFGVDRAGRVQGTWNPAAERRFGIAARPVQGNPLPIVLPGFRAELRRVLDRAWKGEPVHDLRGQGLPEKGPSFPLTLSLLPVKDPEGAVAAVLVLLGEDAVHQARVTTLAVLLGEKSALLDAVRSARIVLWSMDPGTGRITQASSAVQEVLGVSREALLADAASLRALLGPADRERLAAAQAEALEGRVGTFEAALARGQGRAPVWTRWILDLVDGRLRGVIQDITEARALQEKLEQARKLEVVGEFVSTVTHDFNNLLMSILGYNDLLLLDPALSPDQRRRLEAIRRCAARGQALAGSLLDFARRTPVAAGRTQINDPVGEVVALLDAPEGPVRFRPDLDPGLPPVAATATELHQVIMNLAVNARDAMPGGGEVVLRTSLVQSSGETRAAFVLLEVRDTGTGIPDHVRERIFERFFTTKAEGKGTGLGLAVVLRIVTSHGGRVTFESRMGEGTVFRVLLPALPPED